MDNAGMAAILDFKGFSFARMGAEGIAQFLGLPVDTGAVVFRGKDQKGHSLSIDMIGGAGIPSDCLHVTEYVRPAARLDLIVAADGNDTANSREIQSLCF